MSRKKLLIAVASTAALAASVIVPLTMAEAAAGPVFVAVGTYNQQDETRYNKRKNGSHHAGGVTSPTDGRYAVQTQLWNPAVEGGFTLEWDDAATTFTVRDFTANAYFGYDGQNSAPGQPPCTVGADPNDPDCAWAGKGDPWVPEILPPGSPLSPGDPDPYGWRGRQGAYLTAATDPYLPADDINLHKYVDDSTDPETYDPQYGLQIHAPAAYPSIYQGCHWGSCTGGKNPSGGSGGPYPLQLTGIAALESIWQIEKPEAASPNEAWNAAYDLWFDTNLLGFLPHEPDEPGRYNAVPYIPGQNDGTEIMIWINNRGYAPAPATGEYVGDIIQPAGKLLLRDVTVPGIKVKKEDGTVEEARFDIWGGRVRSWDYAIRWNVVSFVVRQRGTELLSDGAAWGGFDAHAFSKYAAYELNRRGLTCDTTDPLVVPSESTRCLDPTWWLTSIQAGFEIWNLPSTKQLSTKRFMTSPVAVSGGINTGGRAVEDGPQRGTPLVFWLDTFDITAQGCASINSRQKATAQWSIDAVDYYPWDESKGFDTAGRSHRAIGNPSGYVPPDNGKGVVPVTIEQGAMVESPANSGNFIATGVGPMKNPAAGYILHGDAILSITITCPDGQVITTQSALYIDPSGDVRNTIGEPIAGATVTLYRSDTETGTYVQVPDGSAIMSPENRTNPDLTDSNGAYRWDTAPGWYKVRAEMAGCTKPGTSDTYVESPPKQISASLPPVTDLQLVLYCGEVVPTPTPTSEPSSNVDITLRQITSWPSDSGGGYCSEIVATNRTGAPVDWTGVVTITGNIYTAWNFNRVPLGGNQFQVSGVEWNRTLQPYATTHSVGFCANN